MRCWGACAVRLLSTATGKRLCGPLTWRAGRPIARWPGVGVCRPRGAELSASDAAGCLNVTELSRGDALACALAPKSSAGCASVWVGHEGVALIGVRRVLNDHCGLSYRSTSQITTRPDGGRIPLAQTCAPTAMCMSSGGIFRTFVHYCTIVNFTHIVHY